MSRARKISSFSAIASKPGATKAASVGIMANRMSDTPAQAEANTVPARERKFPSSSRLPKQRRQPSRREGQGCERRRSKYQARAPRQRFRRAIYRAGVQEIATRETLPQEEGRLDAVRSTLAVAGVKMRLPRFSGYQRERASQREGWRESVLLPHCPG